MEIHIKNVDKRFTLGLQIILLAPIFFHAQVCKFWPAYDAKKHNYLSFRTLELFQVFFGTTRVYNLFFLRYPCGRSQ